MADTNRRGPLAAPVAEALQMSEQISQEWDCTSGSVRTCIAQVCSMGAVKNEGRGVFAFILALDMDALGLNIERQLVLLAEWNLRVKPPLSTAELRHAVKQASKARYHPYSCDNPWLSAYCIGDDCPHHKSAGRWSESPITLGNIIYSDWLSHLSAVQLKTFLGLYRWSRMMGRGPKDTIHFTFAGIERISGVSRKYIRKTLIALQDYGLIRDVAFSKGKGYMSSFKFPVTLPTPLPKTPSGKNHVGKYANRVDANDSDDPRGGDQHDDHFNSAEGNPE